MSSDACWGVVGVVADNCDLALAMAHGQERGARVRALRATGPLASGCGVVRGEGRARRHGVQRGARRRAGGRSTAAASYWRHAVLRLQEEDDVFAENPLLLFFFYFFYFLFKLVAFLGFNWGTKAFYKNLKIFM